MDTFGKRLKHLIKNSDVKTVKSFAEKASIHENSLSRIINKGSNPSYDIIIASLELFSDADVLWLLTGKKNDMQEKIQRLERENLDSKKELETIKTTLAKYSSNGMNSRLPIITQGKIDWNMAMA